MSTRKVIALGMDAMDASLVEDLLARGRLPHLARLRERGAYGPVASRPPAFLSMVWPTFFTAEDVGSHAWYFNKLWDPKRQTLRYVDGTWLPIRAFWEDLPEGTRAAVLDVPFSTRPGARFQGTFLNGWQAHDDFGKLEVPSGLHARLRADYGPPQMGPELFGPQDARTLHRQRKEALGSLEQFARIVAKAVGDPYDLVVAVFGGAHRGGHYLRSLDEADLSGASPEDMALLSGANEATYEAADRALGIVLEAAPADAVVIAFALHGMGRNRGWAEYFPEILRHLHAKGEGKPPRRGALYRLKTSLPFEWVRPILMGLPSSVNHALVPIWSRRMLDWSRTRYFALPLDLNGYIRLNVRGREARGIVNPGREVEEVVAELTRDLLELRNLRDGSPVVARVLRVEELVGEGAPRRDVLPDLIAEWTDSYAHGSHGVGSRYGEVRWSPTAPLPSGRSGNHTPHGCFAAAGPGVARGPIPEAIDSKDLAPTLLTWTGRPLPERFQGRGVARLIADHVAR
jgi:predicted AlkP superfamily phosphohydrolase/phosphomutase